MGCTGRPTRRPTPSSWAGVPVIASTAVSPRLPESIAARRTASTGRSEARATASVSTPSSAPVRSSPSSTPAMNACSRPVAAAVSVRRVAARSAADPAPAVASSRSKALSRSATVRLGSAAGSPMAADMPRQPIPTRPWRGLAISRPTAVAISAASTRRSRWASASTFASRDRVDATASAVLTSSSSSMAPVCHGCCAAGRRMLERAGTPQSRLVGITIASLFITLGGVCQAPGGRRCRTKNRPSGCWTGLCALGRRRGG